MTLADFSGFSALAILLFLSALHVYWGLGGLWPVSTEKDLAEMVVGVPSGRMPGLIACFAVAFGLVAIAFLVVEIRWPTFAWDLSPIDRVFADIAIAIFTARGLLGFVDHKLRPATVALPFYRLNRIFYSPLCLVLAALLVHATHFN